MFSVVRRLRDSVGQRVVILLVASVVLAVASCPVVAGPASAASSPWTQEQAANPPGPPSSVLGSVSCPSASTCMAVGGRVSLFGPTGPAHAQIWNGVTWIPLSLPVAVGLQAPVSTGVSCPSVSLCFAVGFATKSTGRTAGVIWRWDGAAWSQVKTVNENGFPDVVLAGIDCWSSLTCVAVGNAQGDYQGHAVAVVFANGQWKLSDVPTGSAADFAELSAVTCRASNRCLAVGRTSGPDVVRTFIARWDGLTWSKVASPTPSGVGEVALLDVECVSGTS